VSAIAPELNTPGARLSQPEPVTPIAPTIANPGPLGLMAFAVTTFLLSMVNANLVNKGVEPVVFGVALMVGGIAQLLAGMWAYRVGNMFSATIHSLYGGFWLSYWALVQFYVKDIPVAQVGNAVGLYLISWALVTAFFCVATLKAPKSVFLAFLLLFLTFLALGIGNAGAHTSIIHLGGFLGLATAAAAAYIGIAEVINEMWDRTVLPLGA
jgi:succinate-acetate transporter protein